MNQGTSQAERRMRTGLRIRRERILWGMTQEELSDLLGISANYLSQIERGNRNLSRKMEDRMCALFHLDRNELNSIDDIAAARQLKESDPLMPRLTRDEVQRLLSTCTDEELQICGNVLRSMLLYLRHSSAAVLTDGAIPYMAAARPRNADDMRSGSAGRLLSMIRPAP